MSTTPPPPPVVDDAAIAAKIAEMDEMRRRQQQQMQTQTWDLQAKLGLHSGTGEALVRPPSADASMAPTSPLGAAAAPPIIDSTAATAHLLSRGGPTPAAPAPPRPTGSGAASSALRASLLADDCLLYTSPSPRDS